MTNDPSSTNPPPPIPSGQSKPSASTNDFEPLTGGSNFANVIHHLLKKPLSLVYNLEKNEDSGDLPLRLLLISVLSLAIFGLIVGAFSGERQLWAAPLKIVCGLLFSGLICLPSLYIFACLGGLDARFRTVAGVLCGLIALSAVLLVGFAPVVWLFSVSSTSIVFLGFLLLSLWLICAGFGMLLVFRAGRALGMTNTGHLAIWCGIFFMVTLQMTTTLRPIIGKDEQFLNFEEKKFFMTYWGENLNTRGRDPAVSE